MKQSIASDAMKLTISKIITMMISIITAMLLSRFRTLEEYGTYSQLLLVINLVTTVLMLGLPNSINYFLARTEDMKERQQFLSVYYVLSTILSFSVGFILVLSTPLIIKYFGNYQIKNFMYVLAIFPWAKIILSSIDNVLIVYGKTNTLMLFRVLHSVSLLLIILVIEVFKLGFSTYMILFIIIEVIFAISVYLIVRTVAESLKIWLNKVLICNIFKFSIPLGFASIVGILSVELDKLVIGKFFSVEELAIYTNAAREMPVTVIASSLSVVLIPKLVQLLKENKKEEAVILWGNSIFLSYAIICFFSTALFVFAPEVIALLYSDKYLPAVNVFRVYNIVLLFRSTYFGIILNSIGKTRFIFYSSIASLVLNIVLNYLFYHIFGFIGPAIATFISIFLVAFLQLIVTTKMINYSFKKIFPWRGLINISVLNFLIGLVFFFVKKILPLDVVIGNTIESILLGIVWSILYLCIMFKIVKRKWSELNGDRVYSKSTINDVKKQN